MTSGHVAGKKAVYDHASKLKLKEADYAAKYGYVKQWGGKKLCFTLALRSSSICQTSKKKVGG